MDEYPEEAIIATPDQRIAALEQQLATVLAERNDADRRAKAEGMREAAELVEDARKLSTVLRKSIVSSDRDKYRDDCAKGIRLRADAIEKEKDQ